jgi:hypothetical protein
MEGTAVLIYAQRKREGENAMREYDNMPVLDWTAENSALKAKAQILHQEPVILLMPESFDCAIDGAKFHCQQHEDPGILVNCDGGAVLNWLADCNNTPTLRTIAEACIESSSQVDIDVVGNRIIVHD